MIEALGVPHTEVELVFVNGETAGFERALGDGDRVAVYPEFELLDVTPLLRVRLRHPVRQRAGRRHGHNDSPGRVRRLLWEVFTAKESTMIATELRLPELALIAGTRGMLGAGVGLLLADRLSEDKRKGIGWTLMAVAR